MKTFQGSKTFLLFKNFQSELPEKLEASTGFPLALLETMAQGVSFEAPYTIQMLKPISGKINISSINKFLNFQIFQNVLSEKLEASTGFTLAFH